MVVLFVALGLILGSFLNMLIYRLPRKEGIWGPRSRCPSCGAGLGVLDLIPVLSYIALRGRCRYCRERIPIRYLFVEIITALAFGGFYMLYGPGWLFYRAAILFLLLFPAAIIDWQHQILPDELTLGGLIFGLLLAIWGGHLSFWGALLGALVGGGFLFIIAYIYPQGMGGGDIKLMAMVGSFVGWPYVLAAIFIGAFLGLLYFGYGLLAKKVERNTPLPFGSFLALGTFLALFFGPWLLNFYINLLGF